MQVLDSLPRKTILLSANRTLQLQQGYNPHKNLVGFPVDSHQHVSGSLMSISTTL